MLIPKFKLNYMQPSQRTIMKDLLIRSVQAASEVDEISYPATAAASSEPVDDSLFSFMNESSSHSTDTTSLTAFPRLVTAFHKYNERLFNTAGQILTARRWKMSDTLFEQAVFLRYKLKE